MTREERTKLIRHLKYSRSISADYLITDKDADEIIKVLEQESVLDKIRADIEKKIEQEEFARSVFRHEEKDSVKAEQCTGSILLTKM